MRLSHRTPTPQPQTASTGCSVTARVYQWKRSVNARRQDVGALFDQRGGSCYRCSGRARYTRCRCKTTAAPHRWRTDAFRLGTAALRTSVSRTTHAAKARAPQKRCTVSVARYRMQIYMFHLLRYVSLERTENKKGTGGEALPNTYVMRSSQRLTCGPCRLCWMLCHTPVS